MKTPTSMNILECKQKLETLLQSKNLKLIIDYPTEGKEDLFASVEAGIPDGEHIEFQLTRDLSDTNFLGKLVLQKQISSNYPINDDICSAELYEIPNFCGILLYCHPINSCIGTIEKEVGKIFNRLIEIVGKTLGYTQVWHINVSNHKNKKITTALKYKTLTTFRNRRTANNIYITTKII